MYQTFLLTSAGLNRPWWVRSELRWGSSSSADFSGSDFLTFVRTACVRSRSLVVVSRLRVETCLWMCELFSNVSTRHAVTLDWWSSMSANFSPPRLDCDFDPLRLRVDCEKKRVLNNELLRRPAHRKTLLTRSCVIMELWSGFVCVHTQTRSVLCGQWLSGTNTGTGYLPFLCLVYWFTIGSAHSAGIVPKLSLCLSVTVCLCAAGRLSGKFEIGDCHV